ncbi:hypothetical protein N5K21_07395 [Rhizobium pusense]|uniref:Uncharacterized protein n=1 Tax=Agrobacterium pusense TaxID=648995 RepID=A0A6H0ZP09_9HYPH|nr:hypothetical protein [Agrobacterium pusense]MDH2088545.1 hypothetical protein [Agrobacterium pusense]QIX22582.1 hypothetical protein FOB41_16250 [Agrobacterium pusense]WCK24491.1 hypothetical protein CFBP5496_0002540 [Agrobacterium pusense]
MELQIEIAETEPTSLDHLSNSGIVNAFREAEAVLSRHGIDRDQAATVIGLSPITLKAYAQGVATVSHRRIPAATLDRIRDLAVDAYWRAAAWPYRCEVGGEKSAHLTPVYTAHDRTGLVRARHPHPLRIREVADKLGGSVRVAWSANLDVRVPPLDASASLRSRWRIGVWQIRDQFDFIGRVDVDAVLCEIVDCCRYSLWSFSTEYRPWMAQVTTSQVERLEAAIADIERGDEIQPWESEVAKAMADLEDF